MYPCPVGTQRVQLVVVFRRNSRLRGLVSLWLYYTHSEHDSRSYNTLNIFTVFDSTEASIHCRRPALTRNFKSDVTSKFTLRCGITFFLHAACLRYADDIYILAVNMPLLVLALFRESLSVPGLGQNLHGQGQVISRPKSPPLRWITGRNDKRYKI